MHQILRNSLYSINEKRYEEIRKCVTSFNSLYNKNNIIQDDIFNIIENFVIKNGMSFELLRFPIDDKELCACTFIRQDTIFVMINSKIPLSKQIFAAAHELYHIYRYFNEDDSSLLQSGSILESKNIDEAKEFEDLEANAFAALLLAPRDRLEEQSDVYDLNYYNIRLSTILKIMDIFAIPYKAAVIRLYEENKIGAKMAEDFLLIPDNEISKQIEITGKSSRWQEIPNNLIKFGSLEEKMYDSKQKDIVNENRFISDKNRLIEIINSLKK